MAFVDTFKVMLNFLKPLDKMLEKHFFFPQSFLCCLDFLVFISRLMKIRTNRTTAN